MKFKNKTRFNLTLDKFHCQKYGFKQIIEKGLVRYTGSLQPTVSSFKYQIEIKSFPIVDPYVFVTNKVLNINCKHIYYNSMRLCLYNLQEYKWHQNRSIGIDIIPLVASWLYFYEKWETTGIWYYDEYPHQQEKLITN